MVNCVICPTFSPTVIRLIKASIFAASLRLEEGRRVAFLKNSPLSLRSVFEKSCAQAAPAREKSGDKTCKNSRPNAAKFFVFMLFKYGRSQKVTRSEPGTVVTRF
jgi:hypothetical protein